ncbi:response regulator [uncultured Thiohalocapsa sp.]|uniref:response regulator n=1 Tax=uncultured Thiohalocapsa sp. TaxID=768990 RepID=UPI0025EF6303|nr:response regulator [uncultured Thiohalocapsa sp.]
MARTTPEILVVDDEPEVCWALSWLFHTKGYPACAVQSGAEALAALGRKAFTHILLDAKLQDWDGLALAAEARTRNPGAVVLLISAYFYRDDPDIARALAAGHIDGFISKPFTHAEILRCISPQVTE